MGQLQQGLRRRMNKEKENTVKAAVKEKNRMEIREGREWSRWSEAPENKNMMVEAIVISMRVKGLIGVWILYYVVGGWGEGEEIK
ncbi:hypothetical protein SDJN03_19576, partial [Cucurbita argyrosperma subsp. sororia]